MTDTREVQRFGPPGGRLGSSTRTQRINDASIPLKGTFDAWQIISNSPNAERVLTGQDQYLFAEVLAGEDPGDGTVPGQASGAAADKPSTIACRINGYTHDQSYNNNDVRASVLDAIVRICGPVKVCP